MNTLDHNKSLASLKGYPVSKIFLAAFITQFCMGFEVLLRISAATTIKHDFFDVSDPLTSGAHIGEILGVLFLGFAIANFVMAPFVDAFGQRRVHVISLLLFLGGTLVMLLAEPNSESAYLLLWGGSLLQGFAWGSIEAVLNPLVVSIYPTKKVAKLNLFHAAYALGVLIAAPLSSMVDMYSMGWKLQVSFVFIPAIVALILISRVKYPPSERVTHGVSFKEMFSHTLSRPLFYLCMIAMFLTAATELVPSNWLDLTLTKTAGIQGFWLVAFIYTVQVVVKSFAGVLVKRLGSAGILVMASLFAIAGLLLLSQASGPVSGLLGALVFGIGTAVMWPTTLAATSERFPKGGSFAIGTMASAGMLSTYIMTPMFGRLFDSAKIASAGGKEAFEALQEGTPAYDQTIIDAATMIFHSASFMPVITVVFFACLWVYDQRSKKRVAWQAKMAR